MQPCVQGERYTHIKRQLHPKQKRCKRSGMYGMPVNRSFYEDGFFFSILFKRHSPSNRQQLAQLFINEESPNIFVCYFHFPMRKCFHFLSGCPRNFVPSTVDEQGFVYRRSGQHYSYQLSSAQSGSPRKTIKISPLVDSKSIEKGVFCTRTSFLLNESNELSHVSLILINIHLTLWILI